MVELWDWDIIVDLEDFKNSHYINKVLGVVIGMLYLKYSGLILTEP